MSEYNRNYQERTVSRARGVSRSRTAAESRGAGSQRTTGSSASTVRSSSYSGAGAGSGRRRGSQGGGRRRREENGGAGLAIGMVIVLLALAAGFLILKKSGLLSAEKEEETTAPGTESAAFDPNVISRDLYLDYSAFAPEAELLNLKGMNREAAEAALRAAYSWDVKISNANPNLGSFSMPQLPEETESTAAVSETGVDSEGTEVVVQVENPYAGVEIRPDRDVFLVPDLIGENISSFVEQIFAEYEKAGESKTGSAPESGTGAGKGSEEGSFQTESTAPEADYVLELPDFSEKIRKYTEELALVWKMDPINGDITEYNAANGEFVFGGSVDGYAVNAAATAEKLVKALSEKNYSVSVSTEGEKVPAAGDSIRDKYATIGSYMTKTTSNAVRNMNIKLAAAAVNGTILKPGQEFSFNGVVGQRTKEKGYGGAPAYNQGEVVEEVGGGICQVSTTLYNAVFRSGLTTTYRRAHTFAPNYVTPGMDATVSWPGPDYKFINDSSHAIGIRAWYSDQSVTVQIYGIRVLPEGVSWELKSEKIKDLPVPEPQIITPEQGAESNGSAGSEWQAYKIITTNGVVEKVKDHYTSYKGHTPKKYAEGETESSSAESGAEEDPTAEAPDSSLISQGDANGPGSSSIENRPGEETSTEKRTESTAQRPGEEPSPGEDTDSDTPDGELIDSPNF